MEDRFLRFAVKFQDDTHLQFKFITLFSQSGPEYNAFKRDIAVLNLFFGESTALGKAS